MSQVRIPPVSAPRPAAEAARRAGHDRRPGPGRARRRLPRPAPSLLDDAGEINRFVNVFVNETDVRHLQDLDTPLAPTDTVLLLPAMAGG